MLTSLSLKDKNFNFNFKSEKKYDKFLLILLSFLIAVNIIL